MTRPLDTLLGQSDGALSRLTLVESERLYSLLVLARLTNRSRLDKSIDGALTMLPVPLRRVAKNALVGV